MTIQQMQWSRTYQRLFFISLLVVPLFLGFVISFLYPVRTTEMQALWYLQKAAPLILLLVSIPLLRGYRLPWNELGWPYCAMMLLAFTSLGVGLLRGGTGPYVWLDFLGLLVPPLFLLSLIRLLEKHVLQVETLFALFVLYGVGISAAAYMNNLIAGGSKIMFPLQIAVPLVLGMGILDGNPALRIFSRGTGFLFGLLLFWAVCVGAVACNSRTYMGMVFIAGLLIQLRNLFLKRWRSIAHGFATYGLVFVMLVPLFGWHGLIDRIANRGATLLHADDSMNQRIVEMGLIWKEVSDDWTEVAFGKGAGATYTNDGRLFKYGDQVHNAHNSFAVVLLRTGFAGVIALLLVYLTVFRRLINWKDPEFIFSLMFFCVLAECLVAQFIYWSVWLPLISATVWAYRRATLSTF